MSQGIPYADIVILALIAGFILLRLRSVLGNKPDGQRPDFLKKEMRPLTGNEPIVQLDARSLKNVKPREEPDPAAASIDDAAKTDAIAAMKAIDPQFSMTVFLDGAKRAFEMVFDAFAKGDKTTLKMLLSDALYKDFCREIDARETGENKTEVTLVSVTPKEVEQLLFMRNIATIGVHFSSEQVTLVRNSQGEIIEGNASELNHVEDHWLFERDMTSKSPNWKIIET